MTARLTVGDGIRLGLGLVLSQVIIIALFVFLAATTGWLQRSDRGGYTLDTPVQEHQRWKGR